jgi:hypothetical protein
MYPEINAANKALLDYGALGIVLVFAFFAISIMFALVVKLLYRQYNRVDALEKQVKSNQEECQKYMAEDRITMMKVISENTAAWQSLQNVLTVTKKTPRE